MSLLTMMEAAADRLGIVRPTVVYASTDQQIRQLLSLANQEGKETARACHRCGDASPMKKAALYLASEYGQHRIH